MSAADFLDTNVLIYAVSPNDERHVIALDLLAKGGTISVQVLNEFANVARRKLRRSWPEISQALADLRRVLLPAKPLTVPVHERAVKLSAGHSLSFYDALIVASALDAGCTRLLSEDMEHGRVFDRRLTIQNPFRSGFAASASH